MYKFERRLELTKKSFKNLEKAQNSGHNLAIDELEVFIILARTITFVMQKELDEFPGFKNWYLNKRTEMKEKYNYFIGIRNEIEKEGKSPIKSGTVTISFVEKEEKVGMMTHSDGKTEDVMGKITNIGYFDKENRRETLSSSKEYLSYLESLVFEAVKRFPETDEKQN